MRDNTSDLVGFKYNDRIYYYIKNAQNDIISILDSSYIQSTIDEVKFNQLAVCWSK